MYPADSQMTNRPPAKQVEDNNTVFYMHNYTVCSHCTGIVGTLDDQEYMHVKYYMLVAQTISALNDCTCT